MSEHEGLTIHLEVVTETERVAINTLIMDQIREKAAAKGERVCDYIGGAIGLRMQIDGVIERGDRVLVEHKGGFFSELTDS